MPLTLRIPYALRALGNVLIIACLAVFATLAGLAFRADRQLRSIEELVNQLPYVDAGMKPPVLAAMRWEMTRLAGTVYPTILFNLQARHIYGVFFSRYAMAVGNPEAARRFAESALAIQPNDGNLMKCLAEDAFRNNRKEEGLAYMERYVATFGADPKSDVCQGLAGIYRLRNRTEEAERLEREMRSRVVAVPSGPCPSNRAAGVPTDLVFDWADCNVETYELFLWKTGEQTPVAPVGRKLKTSQFRPKDRLQPDTVYFWRVKAVGRYGEKTGEIWFFRTARE